MFLDFDPDRREFPIFSALRKTSSYAFALTKNILVIQILFETQLKLTGLKGHLGLPCEFQINKLIILFQQNKRLFLAFLFGINARL